MRIAKQKKSTRILVIVHYFEVVSPRANKQLLQLIVIKILLQNPAGKHV